MTKIRFKYQLTCKLTMVGAAAVDDISRIFLALGGSMGLRGVVGREDNGVTDAVEGVPEFFRWLISTCSNFHIKQIARSCAMADE